MTCAYECIDRSNYRTNLIVRLLHSLSQFRFLLIGLSNVSFDKKIAASNPDDNSDK
jgi:hypothetical protein